MTVLLDENVPLGLLRRLQAAGIEAEHVITLGWRGAPRRMAVSASVSLTGRSSFSRKTMTS